MTAEAVAEECPNCGAPLRIEADGTCHWCHAQVWLTAPRPAPDRGIVRAVAREQQMNLCHADSSLPRPAFPLLSGLWMLSFDPVVQDFFDQPGLLETARLMTGAVQAAGERVRDAGPSDDMLPGEKSYTPEDWWAFDLGFDLMAMLVGLPGLAGDHRALARETVKDHDDLWRHHAEHELKKAGDGPAAMRQLRVFVPHRAGK